MSADSMYEAVRGRDARFDGVFFTAVLTTGIYCRPSCPAVTPKRENVRFHPTAAAAQAAGFRACRRCRPDAVPGSAEWNVRADVVGRAMRLIGDGVVDREGVAGLAARLGYSARQVQRQLTAELGAGPQALARAQRAHAARILLQTTELPAAEVAFAAGFASVRQFNETVREIYATTPSGLRSARGARERALATTGAVPLRLAFRGPYAAREIFDWLERRAIPGVEYIVRAERGGRVYRRTLRLPHGWGLAEVHECAPKGRGVPQPSAGRCPQRENTPPTETWLQARLTLASLRDLTAATQRLRRLLDLDADPYAVAETLTADPVLRTLLAARPGLRSPGAADPHEMAVRAVLGQQVSVAAGRTLAGTLVAAYGEPLPEPSGGLTHLFPAVETLAGAALTELGMPEARRAALRTVAAALADGSVRLDPGVDRDDAEKALLALRGVGPWTSGYIRMRALGDPDVLLAGDVAVRAGARRAGVSLLEAERWRPWRSYAMHHLWLTA
jgi:AraC family transcriptional regulator of adaptative response / DNA-3-methyladenine glycosylase II